MINLGLNKNATRMLTGFAMGTLVMLCIILFNTPVETYISYSLNRIIDTGIGVLIALLLNRLLPRDRLIRWLKFLKLRNYD